MSRLNWYSFYPLYYNGELCPLVSTSLHLNSEGFSALVRSILPSEGYLITSQIPFSISGPIGDRTLIETLKKEGIVSMHEFSEQLRVTLKGTLANLLRI